MSKTKPDEAAPTPKKGKMKLLLGAAALLAIGAGGAYGVVASGLVGGTAKAAAPDLPKLVPKGADDPYAPPPDPAAAKVDTAANYGEGGSEYRTIYYNFEDGFTSNLKDSAGLVQVSLAASTRHDGRVMQWLDRHELAVRSAILIELASTPEDDVFSIAGKQRLQARLTKAVNAVLIEQEGFGGVESIHFQSFLVQ